MKLLTFDYEPSSRRGGQELSLVDECVGLRGEGHDVVLGYVVGADLLERYRSAGVITTKLDCLEIDSDRRLFGAAKWARSVARAARTAPDVVVVNQYHDSLLGAAVARIRGTPLVCHLRLMPPDSLCRQWRTGLANVARFIAVSSSVRDAWVARCGLPSDSVDVVHDGIDMRQFESRDSRERIRADLGIPGDAFVMISVGRIDPSKNLEALVRTFAGLGLGADRARLLVVGRPVSHGSLAEGERYLSSLKQLACELGVHDAVHWLGARSDVPDLLAASDLSALFSTDEPFGRVTVEALACGIPMMAGERGGTREILSGEFARLAFDVTDAGAAVALARSLVGWQRSDPGFSDRARAHVARRFSNEAMVKGIAAVLERAHSERTGVRPSAPRRPMRSRAMAESGR